MAHRKKGLLVAVGWAISAGLARQGWSWSAQSDKEVPSNRSGLVINPHPIVRDIRTEHDISQKIEIERLNDHQIVACESRVEGRGFKWRCRPPDISGSEIKRVSPVNLGGLVSNAG
jgi:hypothetical protein